jgi:hypothetical protein
MRTDLLPNCFMYDVNCDVRLQMNKLLAIGELVKRRHVLLHPVRSVSFISALMRDPRVELPRKVIFSLLVSTMLVLLLFPDVLEEGILTSIFPVLGTILGIPLGAGLDWAAFAMLSVYLLRLFPADIVNEHYLLHIFNKSIGVASPGKPALDISRDKPLIDAETGLVIQQQP